MVSPAKLTTTVSTKGQVILPKAVRDQHHWGAGTRLIVENTSDGVVLKAEPVFPPTKPEDVFCSLRHEGPPKTLDEMDAVIEAEVKERHARGRY